MMSFLRCLVLLFLFMAVTTEIRAESMKGTIVDRQIESKNFSSSKIGTSSTRKLIIYLPADYDRSDAH